MKLPRCAALPVSDRREGPATRFPKSMVRRPHTNTKGHPSSDEAAISPASHCARVRALRRPQPATDRRTPQGHHEALEVGRPPACAVAGTQDHTRYGRRRATVTGYATGPRERTAISPMAAAHRTSTKPALPRPSWAASTVCAASATSQPRHFRTPSQTDPVESRLACGAATRATTTMAVKRNGLATRAL